MCKFVNGLGLGLEFLVVLLFVSGDEKVKDVVVDVGLKSFDYCMFFEVCDCFLLGGIFGE